MRDRQEVVVIDGLAETAEVLRAVLEPRGILVSTTTSSHWSDARTRGREHVLVIHEHAPARSSRPHVLVSRLSADAVSIDTSRALPQPFHYADLIAAIDALVQSAEEAD